MKRIAVILLVAMWPVIGWADGFVSGNDLHQGAEAYHRADALGATPVDGFRAGVFGGYVTGVFDAGNGTRFCAPNTVMKQQVLAVAEKFIDAHPELWQYDGSSILTAAFKSTFSCGK